MTSPQEQFTELARRTQENFKHLWEQWSQRSNELLKGVGRSRSVGDVPGNPEEVLDAVFDFAENLIAQQRAFAKQVLHAASKGQQTLAPTADAVDSAVSSTGPTGVVGPRAGPGRPLLPSRRRQERPIAVVSAVRHHRHSAASWPISTDPGWRVWSSPSVRRRKAQAGVGCRRVRTCRDSDIEARRVLGGRGRRL